jgi:glycine cleavage system H protein
MKDISELVLPDDMRYAKDHEWAKPDGNKVRIGLSDYAQGQLGDIVFVELPQVGSTFKQGETFGTVESVKTVAELFIPIGGTILAINTALEISPELVNKSPYDEGWMIDLEPSESSELESLMTKDVYLEVLKGIE